MADDVEPQPHAPGAESAPYQSRSRSRGSGPRAPYVHRSASPRARTLYVLPSVLRTQIAIAWGTVEQDTAALERAIDEAVTFSVAAGTSAQQLREVLIILLPADEASDSRRRRAYRDFVVSRALQRLTNEAMH